MADAGDHDARLEALERQVQQLTLDLARLRDARAALAVPPVRRDPPTPAHRAAARWSGDDLEALAGRYGTMVLATLAMLMAVGVLVQAAVSHGWLTAAVRVGLGAAAAGGAALAGLYFRRRGSARYGDALLAIALAITDLVAWGAGPALHVVPTVVALAAVEIAAIGIAALALRDGSEFLFVIATGGALSAPFVTSGGGGTPAMLLAFGAAVLVGALLAVPSAGWRRAFAVLVGGATVYVIASGSMPHAGPLATRYLVAMFSTVTAAASLVGAPRAWRGDLARAFVATGALATIASGDEKAPPAAAAWCIALGLAGVTHMALAARSTALVRWTVSGLLLPLVSLAVLFPLGEARGIGASCLWVWAAMALAAWRFERGRGEGYRGGVHLLAGGLLGAWGIAHGLTSHRTSMVVALGAWAVWLAWVTLDEDSPLPLAGVATAAGSGLLLAFAQLTAREPYAYVPFLTDASAAALAAILALFASGELIGRATNPWPDVGGLERWRERGVRLALVLGAAFIWGHLELARACSFDLSIALLVLYWAACGAALIIAGRRMATTGLRAAGLLLALLAAVRAVTEVATIGSVALRVVSYGVLGLFLLGTGYLYRERSGAWGRPVR